MTSCAILTHFPGPLVCRIRQVTLSKHNVLRCKDEFLLELSWPWSYGSWIYNYLCNQCLSPLMLWVRIWIRAMCTTLCDKVCQWLATGRWFSPGSLVSYTNKTDRHDITEILLKMALNTIKQTNKQILILLLPIMSQNTISLFQFQHALYAI